MRLSQSVSRKLVATGVAVAGFILLYEATMFDSQYATRSVLDREREVEPAAGPPLQFTASAYCRGALTASGVVPRSGVAAADERLLPVGSVIQIHTVDRQYRGIYTVMDTGPMVRGRNIDIYMWDCNEALRFGRRAVQLVVLRLGWDPRSTAPSLIDLIFGRPDRNSTPVPSPR